MTKLGKFCLYTPLKVILISVFLSTSLIWIMASISENQAVIYSRSKDTDILLFALLFMNLSASILSCSSALNLYKSIRNSFFLSFATFYGFFILLFVFIFTTVYTNIFYAFILNLPFLIPQTYYFVRFRKRLKSGEIMEDFYKKTTDND